MPRPRATPETAKESFVREIRIRRAHIDMTQRQLAEEVGVVPSVMSTLLANPDKISAGRLRSIVQTLAPDPKIVLAFLGYSTKDIQKLKGGSVYDVERTERPV